MAKLQQSYLEFLNPQSEFDHHFCAWATNHQGWSKMRRQNRRIAKRRQRHRDRQQLWELIWDV